MSAQDRLLDHLREIGALESAAGLIGWDREVMMPRAGADRRAEEAGALEAVLHERRAGARLGDLIADAEADGPADDTARAQIRLARRMHTRARALPEGLSARIARVTSRAMGLWAEARAGDDPARFLPALEEIITLKREEAGALSAALDRPPYDALLDDFEPEARAGDIAALFDGLRGPLSDLLARVGDGHAPRLSGHFPAEAQRALARELAENFGYDAARGRLDVSTHPFTSGGGTDVRITTRLDESDPLNCLYSTLHEAGHGVYEQTVDPALALTPAGTGASMGVHESQSRIFENQLGRAPAFTRWLHGRMVEVFATSGAEDAEAFTRAVNRVAPGFIRTEADEVSYNLHIFLRFDLERALIGGVLAVRDLEEAWNARMAQDFALSVPRPALGFLQDIHWSVGLFGYFPTYALGNVYAGCLHAALRADLPDLDASLARGDPSPATGWLAERVQRHGAVTPPRPLIERATGTPVAPEPLLGYLEAKFGGAKG